MIPGTQAIDRAVELLKLVAAHQPVGVRLTDLARLSDLGHSTVHRLLRSLLREGLITQEDGGKRYLLGAYCRQLGDAMHARAPLQELYAPLLQQIATATGDATFLVVQSGFDTLCIARAIGTYGIQALAVSVGHRQPIGVGAGGLAMLAEMPPAEAEALIQANAERLSYYRNLSAEKLRRLVATAREQGYAPIGNHAVAGVIGVGVALRDQEGALIGGISMASIKARMSSARQADVARQASTLIRNFLPSMTP